MRNVIYQIVNLVNGKRYIGSAKNFKKRVQYNHIRELRKNIHDNSHLQNSWNKYGEENFVCEIIDSVPYAIELKYREQYWMDKYDFDKELYNQCPTANSSLGYKHTEEALKKMSEAKRGKNHHLYGKKRTRKTRQNISAGRKDKKPVMQIDKFTNKIIAEFESACEAERQTGILQTNISSVCLQKSNGGYVRKTAGGYRWCFVHNYPENFNENLLTNSTKHGYKPVAQINRNTGEIIKVYESVSEASRQTGIATTNISRVCLQTPRQKNDKTYFQKTAGGFIWKHVP